MPHAFASWQTKEKASIVNLETSLEDNDLIMDELTHFFEELQNRYEISLA